MKNPQAFREMAFAAFAEVVDSFLASGQDPGLVDVRITELLVDEERDEITGEMRWNAELVETTEGRWTVEEYVLGNIVKYR